MSRTNSMTVKYRIPVCKPMAIQHTLTARFARLKYRSIFRDKSAYYFVRPEVLAGVVSNTAGDQIINSQLYEGLRYFQWGRDRYYD